MSNNQKYSKKKIEAMANNIDDEIADNANPEIDNNTNGEIDLVKTDFSSIFNKSNITVILWFLGTFILANIIFRYLFNGSNSTYNLNISKSIDMMFFLFILIISVFGYYTMTENDLSDKFKNVYNDIKVFLDEPDSLFNFSLFLIGFYICTFLFNIPMNKNEKPVSVSLIENMSWIFFVLMLFINGFKYFFDISILNFFSDDKIDTTEEQTNDITEEQNMNETHINDSNTENNETIDVVDNNNEVFNISNNKYTYKEAEAVCRIFDSDLATYDQIENAYNNGGEWCNYGWSKNQLALFPTQKKTWDKIQKKSTMNNEKNHGNDCGRPGINGGYIANPYVKFGVNCYGKKPQANESDLSQMKSNNDYLYPKTKKDKELEKKIKEWSTDKEKHLKLNSFSKDKWSKY